MDDLPKGDTIDTTDLVFGPYCELSSIVWLWPYYSHFTIEARLSEIAKNLTNCACYVLSNDYHVMATLECCWIVKLLNGSQLPNF